MLTYNYMTRKIFNSLLITAILFTSSCKRPALTEDLYGPSDNESYVENPLMDDSATRLWVTPALPNADEPITISFKAGKKSALKGYTGDVYAHIGILEYGVWSYVQAQWDENIDKCKFTPDPEVKDTWHLELGPTAREYFASGTTPLTQIGIVIRNEDGSLKGIAEDRFITVIDDKYKPFQAGEIVYASAPAACNYGINRVDNSTITFVLHDYTTSGTHRDYAYIIGDFNDWTLSNDENSQMKRDNSKQAWWITVSGLDPEKEYRFQYHLGTKSKIEGENDAIIRITDPFSEKILDPHNDKWINDKYQIYPEDQMVYPEGGVDLVSCVKINRDSYPWSDFTMKNPESPVIYEMLFGDWTKRADIAGAMERLDHLVELGVNAVQIMPIQEFDGVESWGYNPSHYFALDKAYGTRKQYKDFIEACHQKGIAVIVDVVYNHNTGSSPLAKLYWDSKNNKTHSLNPYFNVDATHPWSVFHDFNHENEFVRNIVKRSLKYLIEEYNVDGFRFDLSKGFTQQNVWDGYHQPRVDIIKEYNAFIKSVDPKCYVILEHLGNNREEREFIQDGMHPWRNMNSAYITAAEGNSGSNFSGAYETVDGFGASGWVAYMESHDEERMAYKQNKYGATSVKASLQNKMENLAMNAVCFLGVPGPKMIWQMGELGYDYNKWCTPEGVDKTGTGEYETSRKPVKWDYLDVPERKALFNVYAKMNQLRNKNPELFGKSTSFSWNPSGWPMKTLNLSKDGKEVKIWANYHGKGESNQTINIPSGTWVDYLTGETVSSGSYTLPTGKALVLVNPSVE